MEKKFSICVLLVSPIVIPLSLNIKFRNISLVPNFVVAAIFVIGSWLLRRFKLLGNEESGGLVSKFLAVGYYIGLQVTVFIEMEGNTLMFLQVLSNMASIFFAVMLLVMPLRESVLAKYPSIFGKMSENYLILDTISTIVLAECLGYAIAVYLGLAYLSSSWMYKNIYSYYLYFIGFALILTIISKPLAMYLLKTPKQKHY